MKHFHRCYLSGITRQDICSFANALISPLKVTLSGVGKSGRDPILIVGIVVVDIAIVVDIAEVIAIARIRRANSDSLLSAYILFFK